MKNEKNISMIPMGKSCSDENGICPFWEGIAYDRLNVIRAKCNFLDLKESVDYQCTFLWGMLKNCDINKSIPSE